jgi:hypothetical protein
MNEITLQQVQQLLLLEKFVKEIAEMNMADRDEDDESIEKIIIKRLIIEARDLLLIEANSSTPNKLKRGTSYGNEIQKPD